jgi:para-aminobenzoate synthetase/4-amino-4-deoxychorismate lyase
VVALLGYELGEVFQGLSSASSKSGSEPTAPLVEAFAFADCTRMSCEEVSAWLIQEISTLDAEARQAGLINLHATISQAQYSQDIATIQRYIAQGDTYQVNHTFRFEGSVYGHPLALYQRLRGRQPVRYGAFIEGHQRTILSFSPELFVQSVDGNLKAKPMKGTLGMANGTAADLKASEKDRAENLMITDLIRNDLGRICETGSIKVPNLFEVEQVGSVHQMTSTITGRLKPGLSAADVLKASFPCGSVTGAPKKRTMEIIQKLEKKPRNLYCGSIAYFEPDGDFQLNVVIRTLEVSANGSFQMGVGSGITIDSVAQQEWQECMAKAQFITSLAPAVGLIETMRFEAGVVQRLSLHLNRLESSAKALGLRFDRHAVEGQIQKYVIQQGLGGASAVGGKTEAVFMVRLELSASGQLQIAHKSVVPVTGVQKVYWAEDLLGKAAVMNSADPMLAHKTTRRALYDHGWQAAETHGGFDVLFTNEKGEVTEGGRTSVFVKLGGQWLTPPLQCGVLPGVMRAELLSNPAWGSREAVLTPADVKAAERVVVVNALRGVIEVRVG